MPDAYPSQFLREYGFIPRGHLLIFFLSVGVLIRELGEFKALTCPKCSKNFLKING